MPTHPTNNDLVLSYLLQLSVAGHIENVANCHSCYAFFVHSTVSECVIGMSRLSVYLSVYHLSTDYIFQII
jgi:hypothetical protein